MAYVKQLNVGGVAYDIKAAADLSGNLIESSYLKLSGGTMTGQLNMKDKNIAIKYTDRTRGTVPSAVAYRNFRFNDNNDALIGLIENAWTETGESRTRMRTYNGKSTVADYIQLEVTYPASGEPYVSLGRHVGSNDTWTSPQDTNGAVLRNIAYGTDSPGPTWGQNGQVYIRYTA